MHKWFLIILLFLCFSSFTQNQSNVYFEFYLDGNAIFPENISVISKDSQQKFTRLENEINPLYFTDSLSIDSFYINFTDAKIIVPFNQKVENLSNLILAFEFYESLNYQCLHYSLHNGCTRQFISPDKECDELLSIGTYYPQCLFTFKKKIETDCELKQFLSNPTIDCHQPAKVE